MGCRHVDDPGSNPKGHTALEIKLLAKFDSVPYAAFIK